MTDTVVVKDSEFYEKTLAKFVDHVLQIQDNEKKYLKTVKELTQNLMVEKIKLEKVVNEQSENHQTINKLQQELKVKEHELDLLEERDQIDANIVEELCCEKRELEIHLEAKREAESKALEPQILELKDAIATIQKEMELQRSLIGKGQEQTVFMERKIGEIIQEKEILDSQKEKLDLDIQKQEALNSSMSVRTQQYEKAHEELKQRVLSVQERCADVTAQINAAQGEIQRLEKESKLSEIYKEENEKGEKEHLDKYEKINREIEEKKRKGRDKNREIGEIDQKIKDKIFNIQEENQLRTYMNRQIFDEKKKLIFHQKNIESEQNFIKKLIEDIENKTHQKTNLSNNIDVQNKLIKELKKEVDIFIGGYLKLEGIEERKREELMVLRSCLKSLQQEEITLVKKNMMYSQDLRTLASSRNQWRRELMSHQKNINDVHLDISLRSMEVDSFRRRVSHINEIYHGFFDDYTQVKLDKNRLSRQLHLNASKIIEAKQRQNTLHSEYSILQNDLGEKCNSLVEIKGGIVGMNEEKSLLLNEYNQLQSKVTNLANESEKAIVNIDQLNQYIEKVELEILEIKNNFEITTKDRNFIGNKLIDTNDEICILLEKVGLNEERLKNNTANFSLSEEQVRRLKIALAELERQKRGWEKRWEAIPSLEKEIGEKRGELEREREKGEKLMEGGEGKVVRVIGKGEEGGMVGLESKVGRIEAEIAQKKECLLEKDIILEELDILTEKVRSQAMGERDNIVVTQSAFMEQKGLFERVKNRLKAVVAELSVLQAKSIKIRQENECMEEEISALREGLYEEKVVPGVEEEFERMRRREEVERDRVEKQEKMDKEEKGDRERPNFYLDQETGLPKPYGNHAPFNPSSVGTNIRHIRKPNPKQIII